MNRQISFCFASCAALTVSFVNAAHLPLQPSSHQYLHTANSQNKEEYPIDTAVAQEATDTLGKIRAKPVKPKVYALIAAIGDQFSIVSEAMGVSVSPHIEHLGFEHRTRKAPDNLLNLMALQSLDKAVDGLDPNSKRVYLTFATAKVEKISESGREEAVLAKIRADLKTMPNRMEWDKILVATSAYSTFDNSGLASGTGKLTKLAGVGIFAQPNGKGGGEDVMRFYGHKDLATSPDGKAVQSMTYVAPFSYIEIWVLDPRDLSVIDRQVRHQHRKLADPLAATVDLMQSIPKEFLAKQLAEVIESSVRDAVMSSKLNDKRAIVEIGPIEPVKPDDSRN
jgi:hypothetical protein